MSYFKKQSGGRGLGDVITSPFGPLSPPPPVDLPVDIFPKIARPGEPVTITGPFGSQFGEEIRVKFEGGPWQYPTLLGPSTATVTVPLSAKNGPCEVEVNGRTRFSGQCFINPPGGALGLGSDLGADCGDGSWIDGFCQKIQTAEAGGTVEQVSPVVAPPIIAQKPVEPIPIAAPAPAPIVILTENEPNWVLWLAAAVGIYFLTKKEG